VPDLRGRTSIGVGQGTYSGATNRVLAATGGEELHTQAIAELPIHNHANTATATQGTHTHSIGTFQGTASGGGFAVGTSGTGGAAWSVPTVSAGAITVTITNANTGSGTAFNVMQPFAACNKIIKT
jgi:microcystin-dependent protein